MKKTKTCPKCECRKLLRIDWVADYGGADSHSTKASLAIRHEGYSFMGNEKRKLVGDLEAITCSECGYTEYYCVDPKAIEPDNVLPPNSGGTTTCALVACCGGTKEIVLMRCVRTFARHANADRRGAHLSSEASAAPSRL